MLSDTDAGRYCRVCGYEPKNRPWGGDGRSPTYEICPCCGVEYGYEDATRVAVLRYREAWLEAGADWSDEATAQDGLSTEDRLSRVPVDFS
jgi:hypothetical protein